MQNRSARRDFILRTILVAVLGVPPGVAHAEDSASHSSSQAASKSEAAEAWDALKDTKNPALLEAFLRRYGKTFFAEIARARLAELKGTATFPPAKAIRTYPIREGQQKTTDGARQRAMLYEEDLSSPTGRQFAGSVKWRTRSIGASGNSRSEVAIFADVEIPSTGLRMTMLLRRNLDPSLPASHTVELTFQSSSDFAGGGIANAPGILMKVNEQAKGTPLAALSVKVAGGSFLVGLSNIPADRERNLELLQGRSWFDIPIVYLNQHRAILAIEKGEPGERAFKTALIAWGQYRDTMEPAAGVPGSYSPSSGAQ